MALWLGVELVTFPWFHGLASTSPVRTALMRQRLDEAADRGDRGFRIVQTWVPLDRIAPSLRRAVVASEDARFYTHHGIDWIEVDAAARRDWREKRFARGASTLTMQLAKNLYLSTSKSPLRKLKEAFIARYLEATLSKQRILELYLNVIEWGPGVFGAEAAARTHFATSAARLTPAQSVRLAAVVPAPLRWSPVRPNRRVRRRAAVLARLIRSGIGDPATRPREVELKQAEAATRQTETPAAAAEPDRDGSAEAVPDSVGGG